jgi:hypothetical protein
MANKEYRIKVSPRDIKVRDEAVKAMITNCGGIVRVFQDKKKSAKADKVGRKAKYKARYE